MLIAIESNAAQVYDSVEDDDAASINVEPLTVFVWIEQIMESTANRYSGSEYINIDLFWAIESKIVLYVGYMEMGDRNRVYQIT